jgi:predicted Zn-ribbon and HTH transcriptional regulator
MHAVKVGKTLLSVAVMLLASISHSSADSVVQGATKVAKNFVDRSNPVKTFSTLADAIKTGNPGKLSEAVGSIMLANPACRSCGYLVDKNSAQPVACPSQSHRRRGRNHLRCHG